MRKISAGISIARFKVHVVPFIVWVGAIVCIMALFSHRSRRFQILGIARGPMQEISATCVARLESVTVELFDEVTKGQVLAVLETTVDSEYNTELLEAQLKTVNAEIERLRAELTATEESYAANAANLDSDRITEARRFRSDITSAMLRNLELEAQIETDKSALERLKLDSKIFVLQGRLDANDSGPFELQQIKMERDALASKIADDEKLLKQSQEKLAEAQMLFEAFAQREPQHPSVGSALAVIDKEIEVQNRRLDELKVKRPLLRLVSPFDGVVSMIQRGPGETVLAGEPILTVAAKEPVEVVAYTSEMFADSVEERMSVRVMKKSGAAQDSQIIEVGPTVEQTPARMWQNPNIPEWGRPILIKAPPGLDLTPGELVGVKRLR